MKLRRSSSIFFVLLLAGCSLWPAQVPSTPPVADAPGQVPSTPTVVPPAEPRNVAGTRITVLYTTDTHARYEPQTRDGLSTGGTLAIDAQVRRVRAQEPNVLLVDSGDVLSGHPVSNLAYPADHGAQGGALYEMMNLIGYDVMELGNHDFDNGQENLHKLIQGSRFPILCANVDREDGSPLFPEVKPYVILEKAGVRIGLMGLLLEDLKRTTARQNTVGLRTHPVAEAARRLVAELDPQTDLIFALSHQGWDLDIKLAEEVPGMDVIFGGHEHRLVSNPRKVGGTLVCEAGAYMEAVGRMDIVVGNDAIASWQNSLLPLPHDPTAAGPELVALTSQITEQLGAELNQTIGQLATPWRRNYHGESNEGNWIAGAFAQAAGASIGFVNSGSLRKDLDVGPITVGDAMEIMPFQNTICAFSVTGEQLKRICKHNAWAAATQDHGILQVSGVSYSYRVLPGGGNVELLTCTAQGQDVVPDAIYRCVTLDFILFDQPEKYLGFVPENREHLYLPIQEVLIAAIKRQGRVASSVENRIQRVQ